MIPHTVRHDPDLPLNDDDGGVFPDVQSECTVERHLLAQGPGRYSSRCPIHEFQERPQIYEHRWRGICIRMMRRRGLEWG